MDTLMVNLTVFVEEVESGVYQARFPDQFQMAVGVGGTPESAIYDLLNPQETVSLRNQAHKLARWLASSYASTPSDESVPGNVSVFRRIIKNTPPEEGA